MVKIIAVPSRQGRHHWTDWAGFLFCAWLVIAILRRSPMLGMMMLPVCLHDVVSGLAFLVRRPARARLQGWGPRFATYASIFLIPGFLALAGSQHPAWTGFTPAAWAVSVGYGVWMAGVLAAVWTVWQLRYSFSLAPQARELVRTGPYRLVRHPIYAAYLLQYLGMWLGHFTLPFGITLLAWLALISLRVHYEEAVLEATFPEYAQYRQEVGLLCPRGWPGASRGRSPARPASTEVLTTNSTALPGPVAGVPQQWR